MANIYWTLSRCKKSAKYNTIYNALYNTHSHHHHHQQPLYEAGTAIIPDLQMRKLRPNYPEVFCS